jgi:fido (protein-threonine AMPylation protein)
MATPQEKLAASLEVLQSLQAKGQRVFKSEQLSRVHRERLLEHGFLRSVIKGWLMSSRPDATPGDTTPWNASFWEFCARYCTDRFEDEWHLSPELALLIHAETTTIPRQVVVYTPRGGNNTIELLFDTSVYDLMTRSLPPEGDLVWRDGLRLFTPPAALVRVSEAFFKRFAVEARVALGMVPDSSDVLRPLLSGGHSTVAGRLAGAFRRAGRADVADEILETMASAGYDVREADPFSPNHRLEAVHSKTSPMTARIEGLWSALRDHAIEAFPPAPGRPGDVTQYLRFVDDIYQSDAYHSLSIEGYSATPEMVERVRSGDWDPEHRLDDRDERDALAARGYWQAFQRVKKSVRAVLEGENPGGVVRDGHREWYRELFQPFVAAGVFEAAALAGYRNGPVYIQDSRHVPPRAEAMRQAIPTLFDLLQCEEDPSARAVLGHWLLGYVHPYPDGNGRIARFLMNVMLAAGGYPWTVIRVEDRDAYLAALELASVESDIRPFADFLAERVRWSLEMAHA